MKPRLPLLAIALIALTAPWTPPARAGAPAADASYAVGPQYDSTHVYVQAEDFDRFVRSFVATFGGTVGKQAVVQVTPTPSQTLSQLVRSPVGTLSVFGFKTPIPYPFGVERTGYLVTDIDAATAAAVSLGATRLVETFPDPIGRDVVLQWAGGVNMQFYWHTAPPSYAALTSVPENRLYLTADAADAFIRQWLAFSHGQVVSDEAAASGTEIGRPDTTVRRVLLQSGYGKVLLLVSDGHLPWPYGREPTGYEVQDLAATLGRAREAGAEVLVGPYAVGGRRAAMLRFPGGYIAEVHQPGATP